MKKIGAILLCLVVLAGLLLTGCSKEATASVSVQSVSMVTGFGAAGVIDRYAGVVEAGETVNIEKKADMEIAEVKVRAGDEVKAGQVLFVYSTEAVALTLDKQKLEVEQLKNAITTKTAQIEQLKKEQASASSSQQLDYTIQIQELQVDISEATYNITAKEKDIELTQSTLENAEVTSPVEGSVQAINETGTDQNGNLLPYMTVVQTGEYRIRGTINEQNNGSLSEGTAVIVRSRMDDTQLWHGTITLVDWDNPSGSDNSYDMGKYLSSTMEIGSDTSTSSNYPFYITLDADEGLMLGQHVYIEADLGQLAPDGIQLSASYIMDAEGSAWVWAANSRSRLEKRSVTLGEYNEELSSYTVTGGLSMTDYIAFPDATCIEGAEVTYYSEDSFGSETEEPLNPDATGLPAEGDDIPIADGDMPIEGVDMPIADGDDAYIDDEVPYIENGVATEIIDAGNGGDVG